MHEKLKAVEPLLRSSISQIDSMGRISDAVAEAFRHYGLWKLWVPKEFDGSELALPESLRVFEDACRIDGSIGWSLTIGVGGGLFAAYLPETTAAEIFTPANALIAGSGAPNGRLRRVENGYRVSGKWRYASGIHHATWVTANTAVAPSDIESEPVIIAVAVPADAVAVSDTWHTYAMRGTDSHDIAMEDLFVDEQHTFSLNNRPRITRPLYLFPFLGIAAASFAAVCLGLARGGLDAFVEGPAQRDLSSGKAVDDPILRAKYARAESELRAARSYFYEAINEAWFQVAERGALNTHTLANVHLAAVHSTRAAMAATNELMDAAGMAPLYEADRLGRYWRDLRAVNQHALVSVLREADIGAMLLSDSS